MAHETNSSRDARTSDAFVALLDTLVDDFDVIDLLTVLTSQCVDLLGVAAAGILLADETGTLRVMAASTEQIGLLELFQIQNDEGPCMDSYRSGEVVAVADLRLDSRYARFSAESLRAGYPSVCAIPMRLRSTLLGCLNLFMRTAAPWPDDDVRVARSLADVASIAIVQDQLLRRATVRVGQLEHALESRVVIEQAKGMIAEFARFDMDDAFRALRDYARRNNLRLTDVARSLVGTTLPLGAVVAVR